MHKDIRCLYSSYIHSISISVLRRTQWPAMKSATWVSICYESVFIQLLLRRNSWSRAGFYWRSHFFIRGQLYRDRSGHVYRALNSHHHVAALWPMTRLQFSSSSSAGDQTPAAPHHVSECFWQPVVGAAAAPSWSALLDWDDYEAATCEAISPLGLVARGCPWDSLPHSIAIQQTDDFQDVRRVAAKKSFLGCSKDDLIKLARESGIEVMG